MTKGMTKETLDKANEIQKEMDKLKKIKLDCLKITQVVVFIGVDYSKQEEKNL